jgi:hypothetical protein
MNQNESEDHTWKTHMETLMKRKTVIETAEIIKSAISEWYFERGIPEPRWQTKKDPDWWIEEKKKYEK